jgi:hypothetical protein
MSFRRKLQRSEQATKKYPLATVMYYGPSDAHATKLVGAIVPANGASTTALERWFVDDSSDIRQASDIKVELLAFIAQHGARTVVYADRILGCPHEEGIDYPDGESCPRCPFWHGRDRFTGRVGN